MKKLLPFLIGLSLCSSSYAQTGTVTDIDGNVYKTVIINGQEWTAENLKVTHYRNGDVIPNVTDEDEWYELSTGALGAYDNDESNVATYGYLYNLFAANDSRNIAPEGWHVAIAVDWRDLKTSLGENDSFGGELKAKGTDHWESPNTGATDVAGFSALPGGERLAYGNFRGLGNESYFWAIIADNRDSPWNITMNNNYPSYSYRTADNRAGKSVRLVKDVELDASFEISSNAVNTNEEVTFDASNSTGNELEYRWKFERTGSSDTEYSSSATITHKFYYTDIYSVLLEIKDKYGRTSTVRKDITVTAPAYSGQYGSVTDIDGNVYKTVNINGQEWMAENLKVTHYRNGDAIPNVTDGLEWSSVLGSGAYSVYDNDANNAETYGFLYNWFVVGEPRNIAPEGWHVPTDDEWVALNDFLGDASGGSKLKETGTVHWSDPNTGVSNETGFTALPGGFRNDNGEYENLNNITHFWTTMVGEGSSSNYARAYGFHHLYPDINRSSGTKPFGYSIRLIKDSAASPGNEETPTSTLETGTVTDAEGNEYKTVKIGNQEWMAENLKVTHYRNGDAIPNVTESSEWEALSTGAHSVYDNDVSNAGDYGYLYNWYTVSDRRNIAPEGWHVPTDEDWAELETYLGEDSGKKLKEGGTAHWISDGGATNESGFTVLPGGGRMPDGSYVMITMIAMFWSSTELNNDNAVGLGIELDRNLNRENGGVPKKIGLSVRLVRDRDGGGR